MTKIIKMFRTGPILSSPTCNSQHNSIKKRQPNAVLEESGKRGSNSRPQPWQGCALPTELFPHLLRKFGFFGCAHCVKVNFPIRWHENSACISQLKRCVFRLTGAKVALFFNPAKKIKLFLMIISKITAFAL